MSILFPIEERPQHGSDETIESLRLLLVPLAVDDAEELVDVLGDERLREFIGGRPLGVEELRARHAALVAGSPNPDEVWLNWTMRRRSDRRAIGTVQATLTRRDDRWSAAVAWIVGIPWQHKGFATEAARALVDWLGERGVIEIAAHIRPDHQASGAVAARAGLHRTGEVVDGEQVWRITGSG